MLEHDHDRESGPDHPVGHLWRAPAASFGRRAAALAGLALTVGMAGAPTAVELSGVFDSPGTLVADPGNTSCSGHTN